CCFSSHHSSFVFFFFSALRPPPRSPLFPYTTLFRSAGGLAAFGVIEHFASLAGQDVRGEGLLEKGDARFKQPVLEHRLTGVARQDRKSTRLNSSHFGISYAVFCLKKKKKKKKEYRKN